MKKTALILAAFFADIPFLWACPLCGDVVSRSKDVMQAVRFGEGISWSLVVMLGTPFILVAGIAIFLMSKRLVKTETEF